MDLKIADYFDIIQAKTSLLFSVSAEVGACLAKKSSTVCAALREYGLRLGNAFQMVDDALDYSSTAHVMGKNVGDDLAEGKMTLPHLCAMKCATSEQVAIIQESVKKGTLENLSRIMQIIEETDAIASTYRLARAEVDLAINALEKIDDSPYKKAMIQLAEFAVSRRH